MNNILRSMLRAVIKYAVAGKPYAGDALDLLIPRPANPRTSWAGEGGLGTQDSYTVEVTPAANGHVLLLRHSNYASGQTEHVVRLCHADGVLAEELAALLMEFKLTKR